MPELVSKPKEAWSIEVKCKGQSGCKFTYRYHAHEVYIDEFKVSGYFFDSSAVCKKIPFVVCGNCKRWLTLERQTPPKHVLDKAGPYD